MGPASSCRGLVALADCSAQADTAKAGTILEDAVCWASLSISRVATALGNPAKSGRPCNKQGTSFHLAVT